MSKFLQRLKARLPQDLPRTAKDMDAYAVDVLTTFHFPTTAEYKRALIKAVHSLTQATHRAPKYAFYSHLARFEAMRAAVVAISEIEKQAATPPPGEPPIDGKEARPQNPPG